MGDKKKSAHKICTQPMSRPSKQSHQRKANKAKPTKKGHQGQQSKAINPQLLGWGGKISQEIEKNHAIEINNAANGRQLEYRSSLIFG
jgi:hypothetical protein